MHTVRVGYTPRSRNHNPSQTWVTLHRFELCFSTGHLGVKYRSWFVSRDMQPSSLSTPGPTPLLNPLGPNPSGSNISMTASGLDPRGSVSPTFPMPQRHETEPTVSSTPPFSHPLRTIHSSPEISFPQPTFLSLGSHTAGFNGQQEQDSGAGKGKDKALIETLVYPEGEIPVSLEC
jgi:hypothetical protein